MEQKIPRKALHILRFNTGFGVVVTYGNKSVELVGTRPSWLRGRALLGSYSSKMTMKNAGFEKIKDFSGLLRGPRSLKPRCLAFVVNS